MSRYSKLLPMQDDKTVKEQFGWLPTSVYKPNKGDHWSGLINDGGDFAGTRRAPSNKYLPSLRYSKFNADLAEKVVRYWSVEGSTIVDPFAGRATRGVVSVVLGRDYIGYEIIPEVALSTEQSISRSCPDGVAYLMHNADGCSLEFSPNGTADLVFTCPPYHRIEKYISCPNQLSDIRSYVDFMSRIGVAADNIS